MDSYTITIAPNDDSGNSTTLIVDTTGDRVQITDVHLHAAGGLTGGQMPTVDFGLLLRAVTHPAGTPTPIEATATPAPAIAAPAEEPTAEVGATQTTATRRPEAGAAKPRRAKRAASAAPEGTVQPEPASAPAAKPVKATAATAPVKRPRAAAGTAQKTATKKAAKKAAAAPAASSARVYRRTPDDFAVVYQQAKTPAAVAAHYEVPRHTAQGWIRRAQATNPAPGRR